MNFNEMMMKLNDKDAIEIVAPSWELLNKLTHAISHEYLPALEQYKEARENGFTGSIEVYYMLGTTQVVIEW